MTDNPVFIVDAHSDTPTDVFYRRLRGERHVLETRYVPKLKKAQVKIQVMAIYIEEQYKPHRSLEIALRQMESLLEDLAESPSFQLITDKFDLEEVQHNDKIGIILDMEGGDPLEGGVELLYLFYRLGIRMLGITYSNRNRLADGCWETGTGGGLTSYGREILKHATELGMMIDVSHLAFQGVEDVLRFADGNVLASHCAPAAVYQSARNLSDSHIQAIARMEGVIGMPAHPCMLSEHRADTATVMKHIHHLVSIAGLEHVGIGADFIDIFDELIEAGIVGKEWYLPKEMATEGYYQAEDLPGLMKTLMENGYSGDAARKIMGANFLRFFSQSLPDRK
ncbi:MAG: membrane dipeptidase [Clostridiales bacterium]|nr:membrane dipeptidase [Clostridiales bacterium]